MSPFEQSVLTVVRAIPRGRVISYGQLALYAGKPQAAREAGMAMRTLGSTADFPWWRVLNSAGRISIAGNASANAQMQMELLASEGVEVSPEFKLSMEKYCWFAPEEALAKFGLPDWIKKSALHKYGPPPTGRLGI